MKTKFIIILFLLGICSFLSAQGQHTYKPTQCMLGGKPVSWGVDVNRCPACLEIVKKEEAAKAKEDHRVKEIAIKKAEDTKQKAIAESKRQNEAIEAKRKADRENVVHLGVPKQTKVAEVKKGDLKETGIWIPKCTSVGCGFVDNSLKEVSGNEINESDWKIRPTSGWMLGGSYHADFDKDYYVINMGKRTEVNSPCGGNPARSTNTIIINRKGKVLMETGLGDGLIMLGSGPFVLKMIGGFDSLNSYPEACNASLFLISSNKEILQLPTNYYGDESYLKTSAFSVIGTAYVDENGNQHRLYHMNDTKLQATFIEETKLELKKRKAIGCFIYWQDNTTRGNSLYTLIYLRKDGTYEEVKNINDYTIYKK